jgi:hypothetical protein
MALHPGSNPDLGAAGFLAMGAQGELLGSPVAALGAAGAFGGPLMGFDSVHSSSSNNVVMSGTGFGLMGGPTARGMLSPENSFLAEAAQYAHDGLDVPGTAQVSLMACASGSQAALRPVRRNFNTECQPCNDGSGHFGFFCHSL